MKLEFISEWYDGLVQGVVSSDEGYFYAFCISADFNDVGIDRRYWISPMDEDEFSKVLDSFKSVDEDLITELLRSMFLDREGDVIRGDPESWRSICSASMTKGCAYSDCIVYPSVDVLAAK